VSETGGSLSRVPHGAIIWYAAKRYLLGIGIAGAGLVALGWVLR
jgi:hypothetical protein